MKTMKDGRTQYMETQSKERGRERARKRQLADQKEGVNDTIKSK